MSKLQKHAADEFRSKHYTKPDPANRPKDFLCKLCSKLLKSAGPQRLFDHIRGGSVDVTACPGPGDDVENADAKQKAFRELRKKLVEEHEAKQKAAAQKAQRQHEGPG